MGMWFFSDAQMDADGRLLIPIGTLSALVKTAKVPNCPQLRTTLVVHVPVVRPQKPQGSASPCILGSVTTSPFCKCTAT